MSGVLGRWLPVMAWCGVIFLLSSMPGGGAGRDPLLWRVLTTGGHLAEYGVLGVLLGRTVPPGAGFAWWFLGWGLAVLWGVSDEFHQSFVPGRDVEFYDVTMDAIGAAAGLVVWRLWLRVRR
jgi:hypothetical protein